MTSEETQGERVLFDVCRDADNMGEGESMKHLGKKRRHGSGGSKDGFKLVSFI